METINHFEVVHNMSDVPIRDSNINYTHYEYIKQSDNWQKYMKSIGWDCVITPGGIKMYVFWLPLKLFSMIKVPKPKLLDLHSLVEIEQLSKKNRALFVKIEPHQNQQTNFIVDRGYVQTKISYSAPSTLLIDLTKSDDDLWDKLSNSGKYGIRRARREGSIVKTYVQPDDEKISDFFSIYKQTGRAKKFLVRGISDLKKKVKAFGKKSYLLMGYDRKNVLSGAKLFLANDKTIFYVDGATSDHGRANRVGFDLTWRSILYFKNLGYEVMDLEGMYDARFYEETKDWKGFTEFKLKFGAEKIEFPKPCVKFFSKGFEFIIRLSKLEI